jgi:hypothetical protein
MEETWGREWWGYTKNAAAWAVINAVVVADTRFTALLSKIARPAGCGMQHKGGSEGYAVVGAK